MFYDVVLDSDGYDFACERIEERSISDARLCSTQSSRIVMVKPLPLGGDVKGMEQISMIVERAMV